MKFFQKDVSLKPYNSFGVDVRAQYFYVLTNTTQLLRIAETPAFQSYPRLVLGEGTNLLFTKNFKGIVLKNEIKGYQIAKEDKQAVHLTIGGGENWHKLVCYCIEKRWGGIENLILIPGTAGAAPVQNIGAYGIELKDVFIHLEWFSFETKKMSIYNLEQSIFCYRSSIFKTVLKEKGIILSITLRLSKNPKAYITYKAIRDSLKEKKIRDPDIKTISDIIRKLRESRLPSPKHTGNGGSFFKNPHISELQLDFLKKKWQNIPIYRRNEGEIKISAGWLIEKCGLKGYTKNNVGTYHKNPLVVINRGKATGKEIYTFTRYVQQQVLKKFDILLTPEVNIL